MKSHLKAAEIVNMVSRDRQLQAMHRAEHDTTCRVFRTAYKIGKRGHPFADMRTNVMLQELNGVNMGRVFHSDVC